MKLFSKIKAFFRYRGQDAELAVSAAEIKNGKVFLHPEDDQDHVYCIRSNAVDILIGGEHGIREEDLEILETKRKEIVSIQPQKPTEEELVDQMLKSDTASDSVEPADRPLKIGLQPLPISHFMPKMKTVSFRLYPDEYDMLMESMGEKGYKKTEFLLACVSAAKKSSLDATYRRYDASHKKRREADRRAAKIEQEKDFLSKQMA